MIKRGKVLRDTTSGPGLLMLEGQQYRFRQEDWKSEASPRLGQVVDVKLDEGGKVHAITLIPESQLHQEEAVGMARKNPNIDLLRLVAAALLAAAWVLPTAISMQEPFPGKPEFTFWQVLRLIHLGKFSEALDGPGAGLYGLAAAVALAGPFLPRLWKDKRASIGGLLPLTFMIAVGMVAYRTLQSPPGGRGAGTFGDASQALSLGPGAYASILVGLFFVSLSVREWFAAEERANDKSDSPERKAA